MRLSIALFASIFSITLLASSALADPPPAADPTVSKQKWRPENAVTQILIGAESFDVEGMTLPDAKSPQAPSRLRIYRRNLKEDAHGELGHNVYLFRDDVTTAEDVRQAFDFAIQHGFALSIPADAAKGAHPATDQGKWEADQIAKSKSDPTVSYISQKLVTVNKIVATKPNGEVLSFPELVRAVRPVASKRFELNQYRQGLAGLVSKLGSKELGLNGLVGQPADELAKEITGLRGDRETLEKRLAEMETELAMAVHSVTNKTTASVTARP